MAARPPADAAVEYDLVRAVASGQATSAFWRALENWAVRTGYRDIDNEDDRKRLLETTMPLEIVPFAAEYLNRVPSSSD